MKKELKYHTCLFGCDPEFFFSNGKKTVSSDSILPEGGLVCSHPASKIIIDGVQGELNTRPHSCRQLLCSEIQCMFSDLVNHIDKKDTKIDFKQTIKIKKEDMKNLSEKSKTFGCASSKNTYNNGKSGKITVNPETYQYRSAGGHIHLGYLDKEVEKIMKHPKKLVNLLDVILGNTCVLLDRDRGNIERRKVYGKAGEYRTPKHGIEYRTLSNFWLRSIPLTSMVMGLSRLAIIITANNRENEILDLVDMEDVREAINSNSVQKATKIYKKIEKTLFSMADVKSSAYDIDLANVHLFRLF